MCHSECIGGCINSTATGCTACANYRIVRNDTCVDKCPDHLFVYGNLCVNAIFCIKRKKKPFMGECRELCPPGFIDTDANNQPLPLDRPCVKCVDQCDLKECQAIEIDSLATSEYLRGCQVVRGDVYIRLRFGVSDTMNILERNLGDIQEIEGKLKIYRSPAISSLAFFRSLRKIHGQTLEDGKYSFIILQNDNLQTLWDFREKKTLKLLRGNLLIHFNSKLCMKEIRDLQHILRTNASEDFISLESNGYEEICSSGDIQTSFNVLSHSAVEIKWECLDTDKIRTFGYIIYYMEAPNKNITHLSIDSCARYVVQNDESCVLLRIVFNSSFLSFLLTHT